MIWRHYPGCKPHAFQDEKYGKWGRVVNLKAKEGEANCTVCGKTISIPYSKWKANWSGKAKGGK